MHFCRAVSFILDRQSESVILRNQPSPEERIYDREHLQLLRRDQVDDSFVPLGFVPGYKQHSFTEVS